MNWFNNFRNDMNKGFITQNGIKNQAPKYYHDMYKRDFAEDYDNLVQQSSIDPMHPDLTLDRLRVREKLLIKRTKTLKRNLK